MRAENELIRNFFVSLRSKMVSLGRESKRCPHFYMQLDVDNKDVALTPDGVSEAVCMPKRKWFVAFVNHNTEKASQKRLEEMGYETYVAKQTVMRLWKNGRKGKVDRVIIPCMVFVKCTEAERRQIVSLSFIHRFMTNKAAAAPEGMNKPVATIPQNQIDTLRFVLGQTDIPVDFIDTPLLVHDKVRVIRGHLCGMEGEVIQTVDGKSEVIVRIDLLGSAKLSIETINLEILK